MSNFPLRHDFVYEMPRRKSYRKPRKFIKSYTNRKLYQLGRSVQYLKKVINVEYKRSLDAGTVNPSTTGDIRQMCDVAQGDSFDARDGNSVKWVHANMKGFVTKHTSATQTTVRIMLLLDKQPNGALPTLAQVLDNTYSFEPTLRPLNVNFGSRFVLLASKMLTVDTNMPRRQFKWFKKISHHTKYNGATSAITDVNTNSLVMVSVSSEATNTPTIDYNMQSRFIDN